MTRPPDRSNILKFIAVGQSLVRRDLKDYPAEEFQAVLEKIRSADISFTNFEGTIRGRHGGWPTKNGPSHAPPPFALDTLKDIGFNVISLSNNHAFDIGPEGILSTLEEVEKRGFLHAGIGMNKTDAARPGYLDKENGRVALVAMDCGPQPDFFYARGSNGTGLERPGINRQKVVESLALEDKDFNYFQRIGRQLDYEKRKAEYIRLGFRLYLKGIQEFFGIRYEQGESTAICHTLDPDDLNRNLAAIQEASSRADFVIVYAHHHFWSTVWEEVPIWFQDFARQCIDAGGNIFVSHGVPVLQGAEIYKQRPIFYSLGNFIFHSANKAAYAKDSIWQSVVVSCDFDSSGNLITAEFYPIILGGSQAMLNHQLPREAPHLVGAEYGDEILNRFARLSLSFDTQIEVRNGRGRFVLESQ